jgi:thiol:disulfide interchange protein DsbD
MILVEQPLDIIKAFLGGVGVSFTPCVFPLVPVVVGFIGIKAGTTRLRGFLLSLAYVTGVAVTYSVLGLIASLTGRVFGMISTHPVTVIAAGVIIVFFGFFMLDVIHLPIPQFIKLPSTRSRGYGSVFILGLTSGLIVGPCTAPALGAILVYLATKQNILYGTTVLVSFAYGLGLILILAGTFSSLLINLPKSGKWLRSVQIIGALILIGMGITLVITGIRRFYNG